MVAAVEELSDLREPASDGGAQIVPGLGADGGRPENAERKEGEEPLPGGLHGEGARAKHSGAPEAMRRGAREVAQAGQGARASRSACHHAGGPWAVYQVLEPETSVLDRINRINRMRKGRPTVLSEPTEP